MKLTGPRVGLQLVVLVAVVWGLQQAWVGGRPLVGFSPQAMTEALQ